jgi:hypothetical protein
VDNLDEELVAAYTATHEPTILIKAIADILHDLK